MTASGTSSIPTRKRRARSRPIGFGPLIGPNQAAALAVLFLALALWGWSAGGRAWSDRPVPVRPADGLFIELAAEGRRPRTLAFSSPPDLDRVLAAAGLARPADLSPRQIADWTKIIVHRRPVRVEIRPISESTALALGRKMEINLASARDLALLPGIGPLTARRIAADRSRRGPFSSLEDLGRVKGVGPQTIQRIRSKAAVSVGW